VLPDLLHDQHIAEVAKLTEYHGCSGPAFYSDITEEIDAAFEHCVLVERSFMGLIEVSGKDRVDFLHRLTTNDLSRGQKGQIIGTVFTTDKGRVIDYARVMFNHESLLCIVSRERVQNLMERIAKYTIMDDVSARDVTGSVAVISLVGPHSFSVAKKLVGLCPIANSHEEIAWRGLRFTVTASEDFGLRCVDFVVGESQAGAAWNELSEMTAREGIRKMGWESYEAFRIAKGIPTAPHELTEEFNPYEVGLRHAISFTKGCYIGQEVIARLDTYQKIQHLPVCVVLKEIINTSGRRIMTFEGKQIGWVTSIPAYQVRGCFRCFGVIRKEYSLAETTVTVEGHTKGQIDHFLA
jgi:folate-binding protein YgfZ